MASAACVLREEVKSTAPCVENRSFGCYAQLSRTMWVKDGCRGAFLCDGVRTGICGYVGWKRHTNCSCAREPLVRNAINAAWRRSSQGGSESLSKAMAAPFGVLAMASDEASAMEHLRQSGAVAVATRPSAMTAAMASSKGYRLCEHDRLSWMRGGPAQLVNACRHARTDKFTTHHYEHLYHAVLAPIALSACSAVGSSGASDAVAPWVAPGAAGSRLSDLTIRLLEIGLGCGMPLGPGGGVSVFRRLLGVFRLELHVLEYAGECARQWAAENGACVASMGACVDPRDNSSLRGVTVHVGDQNSTRDLDAMFAAAGALPFDVIVDDGSHVPVRDQRL